MPPLNSSNPNSNPDSRCSHRSPSGRRCAQPACSSHPSFCFTHKPQPVPLEQSLAQELAAASASLSSPQDLNRALCKLIQAVIQDHISLKKAGALGFLAQTILQTQKEIFVREKCAYEKQLAAAEEEEERNPPRICAWADDPDENVPDPPPANPPVESPANSPAESPAAPLIDVATPPAPSETTAPRSTKNPAKIPAPPPPPVDLNHFYPCDPTLPPGRQDPSRKLPPPAQPTFRSNARPANRARRAWFP